MTAAKTILVILFLGIWIRGYSQNGDTTVVSTPDGVEHVNRTFLYPGGKNALMQDIADNFQIPEQAKKDRLKGKILLQILIDTSGVANGTIIEGIREDVDAAALEMVKKLKRSVPTMMDDKKVPFILKVPLRL